MRGSDTKQSSMLCLISPEARVPPEHPLRGIKRLADEALKRLSPVFDEMYAATGRPSIPPERLLKATLLMARYTVRSERLLCEQLDYNQRIRKRVEEVFGWFKTVGNFRKTRYRGLAANQLAAHMLGAAYNLLRIAKLIAVGAS